MSPEVTAFYDTQTGTVSYVVADPESKHAAVIDPVLDYNPSAGRVSETSAERIVAFVQERALTVDWILDTHPHADHLSALTVLKERLGGRTAIGGQVVTVQRTWKKIFNLNENFPVDGSQFDHLFKDGEVIQIGSLNATAWHTPGHTPACMTYVFEGLAFVGDTLFMPDYGTARTDFPGGDAGQLYGSIGRILSLPPETRLFTCHDYGPGGRAPAWETTVAIQRANNKHVRDGVDEASFVAMREERDRQLDAPELLLPSLQVNIRGGCLPEPEGNDVAYLKIPVNCF